MRLTCLKCGHRLEAIEASVQALPQVCVCGAPLPPALDVAQGTEPDEVFAEASRQRAFWAAGLVRNWGGIALALSLCGALVFPLALLGTVLGAAVLFFLRDPLRRYSGRQQAACAVVAGLAIFCGESRVLLPVLQAWHAAPAHQAQLDVGTRLRTLRRAELLYFATHSSFADFTRLPGKTISPGAYTVYLRDDTFLRGNLDGRRVKQALPAQVRPHLWRDSFVAVAVANLDRDAALDVWSINDVGVLTHLNDDLQTSPNH